MLHHTCESAKINWVKFDPETGTMFLSFKPKGTVYRYSDVPAVHFKNVLTAKTREEAIGSESPRSEGSYLIHHIIGRDRKNPPFKFEKVSDLEVSAL
jgi:hypothetical protein